MAKYIIADPEQGCGWSHIFGPSDQSEYIVRFVLDVETQKFLALDIRTANGKYETYKEGQPAYDEVLDSVLNANDILANADAFDLIETDRAPEWLPIQLGYQPHGM